MTQADIDEQFRDIPELGSNTLKNPDDVERTFNLMKKTSPGS